MTWDPATYPNTIRTEIHDYDELQARVVEAASEPSAHWILDLGVGAGETARRIIQHHPRARLVGIDSSPEMLRGAARILPQERVSLLRQDLKAPLPKQPFDLVVSALAIHHLEGDQKAALFQRVAERLSPGGRFVVGDVIVPDEPSNALIEIESGYDFPSTIDDHLRWLTEAGFAAEVTWICKDLAVIKSDLRNA